MANTTITRVTDRGQFKEYCLRRLGKPVIEINVTDEQVDDRLDDALKYYWDYHYDGTEKVYLKHQITAEDKANKYITLPDNIIGVVKFFHISNGIMSVNDMFNIRYQIALNDLYTLTSVSMIPYYMTMMHLALIQEILVGQQPIRFSRHRNIAYLDTDWTAMMEGAFLLVECYQVIDPEEFADVWKDQWLSRYTTALIKRQWGSNLTKFTGMTLPGGVQFNGEKIYNDAVAEIEKLENEMISTYSLPVLDMIG